MPRDIASSDKNEMGIYDQLSGSKIIFYYKTVETSDHLKYRGKVLKLLTATQDTKEVQLFQMDNILEFITGFSEGSFERNGKPISSDKENKKNYYEGWKGMLKEKCGDLLLTANSVLFEETNYHITLLVFSRDNLPTVFLLGIFLSRNFPDSLCIFQAIR